MFQLSMFVAPETHTTMVALTERRKPSSGGPRDRQKHLTYQRTYEAFRCRFGVKLPSGDVLKYASRKSADRVRAAVRAMAHVEMTPELFCELAHIAFRMEGQDLAEILLAFSHRQSCLAAALVA